MHPRDMKISQIYVENGAGFDFNSFEVIWLSIKRFEDFRIFFKILRVFKRKIAKNKKKVKKISARPASQAGPHFSSGPAF